MCSAYQQDLVAALCFELPADGTVPDWVELIPAGPEIIGQDGRRWLHDRPQDVVSNSRIGRDLPLDWEHSTEVKAPKGEKADAAAWIVDLEVRANALWGKLEWTEDGRNSVAKRKYRYLSPVFLFERESGRIVRLKSAGLTNSPNLSLTALNREGAHPGPNPSEDRPMKLAEAIRKALGLAEDATEEHAVTAINQMKQDRDTAMNRAESPSLDKFVPRGDYNAALERATNAEQKLADQQKQSLEGEIDTAINQALEDGKITPATADYHKAQCRQEGGLERFKDYVKAAPVIADKSDLDGKDPNRDKDTALNAEQQKIAGMFGNSAEDIAKYGA